ncbi:histidine phosphatase family protein [Paenibacillus sp. UNC499MF]|uniref:histidine phosphatase family protein n=1 Tax=Paenibacillus sp. UNC499MF TaxID=1502751 RepID=UPI0015E20485|nr:histidine phosphatase family protein [Paenibacillus sp. UNC499MF]
MAQTIYLSRHGETILNTQGRYQGELDSPLILEGIEQVKNYIQVIKTVIGELKE